MSTSKRSFFETELALQEESQKEKRLKLGDATHEFLLFNRGDRLWVDAWVIEPASEKCQQVYILHQYAKHDIDGNLAPSLWRKYRWIRRKSEYYRLREKSHAS